VGLACVLVGKKMCGVYRVLLHQEVYVANPSMHSGAYCAATIISLLSLPLDLPLDAPARAHGLTSLLDGLPEYLSRCAYSLFMN